MLSTYIKPITTALMFFPFIAFIFTVPYMIYCYRKYGSIIFIRVLIVYSFILYMMCAYFLVILPLPDHKVVAALTTPRVQLIPFQFVADIIKETIKSGIINRAIIQVSFNIILTVPFGMYLRYYFKCSFKKTVILTFCLSLFYELTQLSGLYFIYARGYRLFDIDDLMLNTLGGLVGYYAVTPLLKMLPTRKQIDDKSLKEGVKLSATRRLLELGLDLLINETICYGIDRILATLGSDIKVNHAIVLVIYLVLFTAIGKCRSIGMMLTSTRLVDFDDNKPSIIKILVRYISMVMIFYGIPSAMAAGLKLLETNRIINENLRFTLYIPILMFWLFIWFYSFIELIKHKTLVYEGLSRTRLKTDIKLKKEKKI